MFKGKKAIIGIIIISTIFIAQPILSDISKSTSIDPDSSFEDLQMIVEETEGTINYSIQSEDKIITNFGQNITHNSTTGNLSSYNKNTQYYYINNSSKTSNSYEETDHIVQVGKLTNYSKEDYGGKYLHKFSQNDIVIESNRNGKLETHEPMFKDVDGDLHLTQSDYITKNGTIPIGAMNATNATYFNLADGNDNYSKGLAIISLNSNKQLEAGPLDSGDSLLLLKGNAPITGFDKTSNPNFVFNLSNSKEKVSKNSAIVVSNSDGRLAAGKLNEGTTRLSKPGKANLQDFEENDVFFINSINNSKNRFDVEEAIINDARGGIQGDIDSKDEIVKEGNGFVTLFKPNISTSESGDVFIGQSNGDQIYSDGEFLYVESGSSKGYQPNEDIVLTNNGESNLTNAHDTEGTFNKLNGSGESNLIFLDLNENGFLDVENGTSPNPGSEPILRTQTGLLEENQNLSKGDSFLKAASLNESFKSINGNWFSSPHYQDISNARGSQIGGTLRYISSSNNREGDYQIGEAILEDAEVNGTLQKSDYFVVGAAIENSSLTEIPIKYHFLNLEHTDDYHDSYPIISIESRDDTILSKNDEITFSGKLNEINDFSQNIEYIDQDESGTYSKDGAIIKAKNPGNDKIDFEDEILNTLSNPGIVDISLMGNYPSNVNSEFQVYVSENQSGGYSRYDPIANIKTITKLRDYEGLVEQKLNKFPATIGYLDGDLNNSLDSNETIYRENDAPSVGTDTYGDRITAVTVENNGTLANQYIESIALKSNATTIATTASPTPNGTWVLEPEPDTGWFGPAEPAPFSLQPNLTDDAPGGKTVALEIPDANDSDGDGSFDPGETGLFLEQDDPRGGLGPGPTLKVPSESSGAVEEELPTPIALSIDGPDGNVSTTDGTLSIGIAANASGRKIVATLQNATDGTAVQSVETDLNATGGAAVAFDPQPGQYQVHVRAIESNTSAVSEPFVVAPPERPGFHSRPISVDRGERSPFAIELGAAGNATLQLEGPDEGVLETVTIVQQNGSSNLELAVETGGMQKPPTAAGFDVVTQETARGTTGWIGGRSSDPGSNESAGRPTEANGAAGTSGEPASAQGAGSTPPSNSSQQNMTPRHPVASAQERVGAGALDVGEYQLVLSNGSETLASAAFQVRAEWDASFETFVVPRDVSLDTAADVQAHASRDKEIATGDQVVVAVNTTGLGTYTRNISVGGPPSAANASPVTRANNTRGRGGDDLKSAGPTPAFVSLGPKSETAGKNAGRPTDSRRIDGTEPGQFYVVAEATGHGIESGTDLETELVLTESSPFVPPDEGNESVETALDVVEAKAGFDGVSPNGSLDFSPQANTPINGTTTVAPGSTLTVHIDGANGSFMEHASVTVDEDGTYQTTANLSEYESGTDYTVSVTADGDQLSPTRSGKFVESASDPAAAGGGGGGSFLGSADDGGSSESTSDRTETEPTVESDGLAPDSMPDLPTEAAKRAWSAVPEPLRIGLPAILLSGLGGLALLTVGRGVFRLLWP